MSMITDLSTSTSTAIMVGSSNIDYYKSVFVDEACFSFYHPKSSSANIIVLGAITSDGIANLSLISPQTGAAPKKSKLRGDDYVDFLQLLMNLLKENGMGERYLVMDNAAIHKTQKVKDAVEKEGFHIHYLPHYSSFLNPMAGFWSKLKAGVKRHLLTLDDTLLLRIIDSANQISAQDCQGWIRHLLSFMPCCING